MRTPPGWYRDPTNPAIDRWWDGVAWTGAVRPTSQAVPPSGAVSPARSGPRHRDAVAVAAVLVVTLALVALVVFVRHEDEHDVLSVPDQVTVPAPITGPATAGGAPVELPADGVEFVEHTGAYSLRVGPDWDEANVAHGIAWYTGGGSRRFRDNVLSIVEDLPRVVALDEYVRLSVANVERLGIGYDERARRRVVLADDNPAVVIDYRSEQGGNAFAHRVVIAVRGRVAVSVTFTTEADRFDAEVAEVMPYLTSVQVR